MGFREFVKRRSISDFRLKGVRSTKRRNGCVVAPAEPAALAVPDDRLRISPARRATASGLAFQYPLRIVSSSDFGHVLERKGFSASNHSRIDSPSLSRTKTASISSHVSSGTLPGRMIAQPMPLETITDTWSAPA